MNKLGGHPFDAGRVVNLLPSPPQRLFRCHAREVVPALVVPVDVARRVGHPCELRDVVGERAKLALALGEAFGCVLRLLAKEVRKDRGARVRHHRGKDPLIE